MMKIITNKSLDLVSAVLILYNRSFSLMNNLLDFLLISKQLTHKRKAPYNFVQIREKQFLKFPTPVQMAKHSTKKPKRKHEAVEEINKVLYYINARRKDHRKKKKSKPMLYL